MPKSSASAQAPRFTLDGPLPHLGGLTARQFMRRHWQKKPLLVRQAFPGLVAPVSRRELFALAARDGVESRLVRQDADRWAMRRGPFSRLPPLRQRQWTLLVQGVDTHDDRARALMEAFRFVPDARLDDLMISYATDGGGVGPHFDSYDVFLVQAHGRRRWRWGRQRSLALRDDVPLKILRAFTPEHEALLEPGDLLYLPPRYAHDGVAEGECMTCSVGFRAPARGELAREVLMRLADDADESLGAGLYADAGQAATARPAELPAALLGFARDAVRALATEPRQIARALGEALSEPKPDLWFEPGSPLAGRGGVHLDRRTRMLYDARHVFINGESYLASGADRRLMCRLADRRALAAADMAQASRAARALMDEWARAGWLHLAGPE